MKTATIKETHFRIIAANVETAILAFTLEKEKEEENNQ
jgi:hypothetical protein